VQPCSAPTAHSRPYWGFHVPHRQATSGELASLRREPGTVSARPLTPADPCSSKDVSTPFVPSLRYDASTKASLAFNSAPTFPGIDFGWGSLLSFCVYGLLETPRLLATPRPYGNRRSVLAWSGWFRHLTYATSCRTSDLQTVAHGLANNVTFKPTIRANMRGLKPTLTANEPTFIATGSQTATRTYIYCIQKREGVTVR
jgi:hypothetical protein